MTNIADVVRLLVEQNGDRYVFGHEVNINDKDPDVFDCSELVQWACGHAGVRPLVPDGSWLQARHCRAHGTLTGVDRAIRTQGALLFRFRGDPFRGGRPSSAHVAVSLGNGSTIEARGRDSGVGRFGARGRGWTHAALIPGVRYETRKASPGEPEPAWPGRYITQPPIMVGADVKMWQRRMRARGWDLDDDGEYGPKSEKVCRTFQAEKGLRESGVVGPKTWRMSWTAPIT